MVLSLAGHVVYSAHDYGPSLFQQTWFNSTTTPASLDAVWNEYWGYIYAQDTAPVRVGEFGTDNTSTDIQSSAAGSQGQWFQSLVSYIKSNPGMGWTYWALNGEDSYDLLDNGYDPTPVSALKQSLLAAIQFPLPGAGNGTPPPSSPPPAQLVRVLGGEHRACGSRPRSSSPTPARRDQRWKAAGRSPATAACQRLERRVHPVGRDVTGPSSCTTGASRPAAGPPIGFTANGTATTSLSITC